MSVHEIRLIPTDPEFVPEPGAAQRALELLRARHPDARDAHTVVDETTEFVAGGEHFESVRCPSCDADLMRYWGDAMDRAYEGGAFGDLAWSPPCCGATTTLNDLTYEGPQGFARFQMVLVESHGEDIPDDERARYEEILGVSLRMIRVHL